jgi:hypothetical protein
MRDRVPIAPAWSPSTIIKQTKEILIGEKLRPRFEEPMHKRIGFNNSETGRLCNQLVERLLWLAWRYALR